MVSRTTVRTRFLLLIIDPDRAAMEALAEQLRHCRIDVICSDDAAEALVRAGALTPDAVLTAATVAPLDGASIARALQRCGAIPTLVGVGQDDGHHASAALSVGARACIPRPYRLKDILPLLRAISPDTVTDDRPPLHAGALTLDSAAHAVYLHGSRISLPLREFQLLHLLMLHAGRVVTRHQINQLVWAGEGEGSNTVNVHIRRLRTRLGDNPKEPFIIVAVRGIGYRLDPPTSPSFGDKKY
ncbi:DNA-binding response OmpR family regulator [Micromonospora sp. Llam0]|uniref:response regulator transcription factor n=1 Tax=Micromonospora sp. Llam0 TaxID=2485143 RepID=UPI000F98D5F5|nr:response regulator transcription factor [Micromonospora sp. Llam0]ROO51513.1 DNA-binding response OmpR family regulator [Micromonospora sp. Llam0]